MVARQRFARLELSDMPAAVLAPVVVAREQERVRHLPAKPPGDVHELGQPDDGRPRHRKSLRANEAIGISLDDFRFAVDDESQCAPHGHHCQRLV